MAMDDLELTGRACSHVTEIQELRCTVHRDVVEPFLAMRAAAASDGFEVEALSAFRDFDGQLGIWNAKYRGQRTLYDADGCEIEHASLTEEQLIDCILYWSALPGASRHHWGTDIDVIDRAAVPDGYSPRLMPDEYRSGGIFSRLADWLESNMGRFGFFRPYRTFRGGVQVEPWHLSYGPIASAALSGFRIEALADAVKDSRVLGGSRVLSRLDSIYERYVLNIDPPLDNS